jgi:hypothetical protein
MKTYVSLTKETSGGESRFMVEMETDNDSVVMTAEVAGLIGTSLMEASERANEINGMVDVMDTIDHSSASLDRTGE